MVGFYATININNYEYNIQSAGAEMCQIRYKLCLTTCVGLLPSTCVVSERLTKYNNYNLHLDAFS